MRWRVGFSLWVTLLLSVGLSVAEVTIEGEIVNAKSGEPIPYVNVGVPGAGEGTVSDEVGLFTLKLSHAGAPVLFTAVGYAAMTIPASRFPLGEPRALYPLTENLLYPTYALDEFLAGDQFGDLNSSPSVSG